MTVEDYYSFVVGSGKGQNFEYKLKWKISFTSRIRTCVFWVSGPLLYQLSYMWETISSPNLWWYISFQSILLFQYSIHAFVFIVCISEIRVHCLYSWFCVDIDTGNISQAARFVENPYSIHTELNCYTVLLHVSCHYIVFQPTWTLEIITN